MYNVDKLEQQWMRYRRKKMILPAASAMFAIALLVILGYLGSKGIFADDNSSETAPIKQNAKPTPVAEKVKTVKQKKPVGKLDILATEVPSLSPPDADNHPKAGQIIFQDTSREASTHSKKRKNLLIQVTERAGKDIAVDIENRFEFAKDKSDSLFLAKYYYDKMAYKKAEKWALETNKLDNTMEESWLIFAKSLAKQGKRVEALKVLRAFSNQGRSMKAKALIDKIRRGKNF